MRKHFITALLYTTITAILLGIVYPLAVTALAHTFFPRQAAGSLLRDQQGALIGSSLIGQPFTGPNYFHSRPSANSYDATNSGGSNLGPTSQALVARMNGQTEGSDAPIDLVTTSGSGLDPDITPAAASFQVARVAAARHLPVVAVQSLVTANLTPRQLGLLGEPRVNVLALNMALDQLCKSQAGCLVGR